MMALRPVAARDLDGILDGFSARVHEEAPFGRASRRMPVELLAESQVGFVSEQPETGVRIQFRLLLGSFDHFGMAVTHVHDADAGRKVDVLSAFNVRDDGISGFGDEDGRSTGHTARNDFRS